MAPLLSSLLSSLPPIPRLPNPSSRFRCRCRGPLFSPPFLLIPRPPGPRRCFSTPQFLLSLNEPPRPRRHSAALLLLIHLATLSVVLLLGGFRARASTMLPSTPTVTVAPGNHDPRSPAETPQDDEEDEDLRVAFEKWKSKTYALTVPLRIVALRGSVPPTWLKDFILAQGKRLKLNCEYRGSLESIFSDLCSESSKGRLEPKSVMAADLVSVGDSWLNYAITAGILEPIRGAQEQDWFQSLNDKWKVYLCRNNKGELQSDGDLWGVPYRWGTMVIAYKASKFRKLKLNPIEDWKDLWRPEFAGRISMVDCPREIVGAVLKNMGASYNTKDIDSQVAGGREAVIHNLTLLQKQVRLFDSTQYLKAFGAGDVWIAAGWSSDVIPAAKRMSDVAVIVPKSGSSLWADLWAIPSACRFTSDRIGGRIRSPSPVIHQWIEFCLQAARGLPFQQEVIPGSSPITLGRLPVAVPWEPTKGKPKLETNLIDGKPPPEILEKCEFLEPLSAKEIEDYRLLISCMQKREDGWIRRMLNFISSFRASRNSSY